MRHEIRMRAVAVCGSGSAEPPLADLARRAGQQIVARGCLLVCGGMGGVMQAACLGARAAREAGAQGRVLGILPVDQLDGGNGLCDMVVPTGMGIARNILVVRSADAVLLLGGGSGTLSEAAYAWQLDKPLVTVRGSGGWADRLAGQALDPRPRQAVLGADSPEEAVDLALAMVLPNP